MRKSSIRKIGMISATIILFSSIIFGFAATFKLQHDASIEYNFFHSNILDQSSALNRVVFAAAKYTDYDLFKENTEEWIDGKTNLCFGIISHGSIPPLISKDEYLKYIQNDPLFLSDKLSEIETEYSASLSSMKNTYKNIIEAKSKEEKINLLLNFDSLFNIFFNILQERSFILEMLEASYHSQLKTNINNNQNIVNLILIGQSIAVLASLSFIFFNFRSQEKDVKILRGLIPICSKCKKVRDDKGYWNQVEIYITNHSEADFSHGICPDCFKELYPGY